MDTVTVDLREGFEHDEVILSAGDRVVARERELRTRTQIGLARSVELALSDSVSVLRVAVPSRGLERYVALPAVRPLWVGLSLTERGLEVEVQEEAFGYV